jgi:hypothetical protein
MQIVHISRGRAAENFFTVIVRFMLKTSASHCHKDKGWPACDWPALLQQHSHLAPVLGSAHTTGHQIWPPASCVKRRWPTFLVHLATILPRWPKKCMAQSEPDSTTSGAPTAHVHVAASCSDLPMPQCSAPRQASLCNKVTHCMAARHEDDVVQSFGTHQNHKWVKTILRVSCAHLAIKCDLCH